MYIKERLEAELQDVTFSKENQELLKERLVHVALTKRKSAGVFGLLRDFWNGSIEIPLPVVFVSFFVLGLGIWNTYSTFFLIDHTTAALYLQTGSDVSHVINQGVSVL